MDSEGSRTLIDISDHFVLKEEEKVLFDVAFTARAHHGDSRINKIGKGPIRSV